MRRKQQGRHLAVSVLELAGEPDLEALRSVATRLGHRHPILHSRVRRDPITFQASWHPMPAQPIPHHHHPEADLDRLIQELLNSSRIDILAEGPNLELHTLTIEPGRWALLLLWPHALFDAIGIHKFIAELGGGEPGDAHGETCRTQGHPGQLWRQAEPVLKEMRTFPAYQIHSLHRKDRAPGPSRVELIRFDRTETEAIQQKMAATAGELLLLPYFACCAARAVRRIVSTRYTDEKPATLISLPVQRCSNTSRRPLFHNHMTPYSLLLTDQELSDLPAATKTLYKKYANFIRRKLPGAMDSLTRLMERCPSRFYLTPASFYLKGEICSVYHSHTGAFAPDVRELFGSQVLNGYHVPSVSSPPGIGIFFSECQQRLTCTLSWREGSVSEEEIRDLRSHLLEDLGAMATPVSKSA